LDETDGALEMPRVVVVHTRLREVVLRWVLLHVAIEPAPLALSDSAVVQLAVTSAPAVEAAQAAREAGAASVRASRTLYVPNVRLTGGYNWARESVVIGAVRPGWQLALGTSLPLFNGFQREDAITRAEATAHVARSTALDAILSYGSIFNQAMTSYSFQTIPAVLAAYDFSGFNTVADIGGGYGHLLGAVLKNYPVAKGVLFEVPPVLDGAPAMLDSYGVRDRVELVSGDFTASIPVVADCYLLKHIIHDWYDDKNQMILGNIRTFMPEDAKVLIIDAVVPGLNEPHFAKFLDLEMLMLPGGKERTEEEFRTLLHNSGFAMTRVIPTQSNVCIIEAVKA